jgi:hypothetical protein
MQLQLSPEIIKSGWPDFKRWEGPFLLEMLLDWGMVIGKGMGSSALHIV